MNRREFPRNMGCMAAGAAAATAGAASAFVLHRPPAPEPLTLASDLQAQIDELRVAITDNIRAVGEQTIYCRPGWVYLDPPKEDKVTPRLCSHCQQRTYPDAWCECDPRMQIWEFIDEEVVYLGAAEDDPVLRDGVAEVLLR